MARGNPVDLATGLSFPTKSAAKAFFKEMLNRYKPRDRVVDDDALHLAALLERHDEYVQKVGCGIDHFEVMMTDYGTQCFRIVRTDGTGTDFSYGHSVDSKPPSRKSEVSHGFRRAVQIDIYKARDRFFSEHRSADGLFPCAATGERIPKDSGHIDHLPPMTFEVIVTTFLQAHGLSLEAVPLTDGRDEQVAPEVTDKALAERFRAYHNRVATLDFVRDKVNLAQSARHRVRSGRIKLDAA